MSARADRIVADYLERLDHLLARLPYAARRQLVDEIAEHVAEARTGLDPGDEVGLLALLDAVGDPEAIAAEALGATSQAPPPRADRAVPWLVLLGGFAVGIGWLVGIVLLWSSDTWRRRDKLLATLVVPGGLVLPVLLLGMGGAATTCTGTGGPGRPTVTHCTTSGLVLGLPVGIAVLVVTVLGPVLVAVHLDRVRTRP